MTYVFCCQYTIANISLFQATYIQIHEKNLSCTMFLCADMASNIPFPLDHPFRLPFGSNDEERKDWSKGNAERKEMDKAEAGKKAMSKNNGRKDMKGKRKRIGQNGPLSGIIYNRIISWPVVEV